MQKKSMLWYKCQKRQSSSQPWSREHQLSSPKFFMDLPTNIWMNLEMVSSHSSCTRETSNSLQFVIQGLTSIARICEMDCLSPFMLWQNNFIKISWNKEKSVRYVNLEQSYISIYVSRSSVNESEICTLFIIWKINQCECNP